MGLPKVSCPRTESQINDDGENCHPERPVKHIATPVIDPHRPIMHFVDEIYVPAVQPFPDRGLPFFECNF